MSDGSPAEDAMLLGLINGYRVTQAIHVVASLGVPDLLSVGPRSSDELATTTRCDPPALYRLLRALATVNILNESAGRTFSLGPLGTSLRAGAPGSRNAWAKFVGRPAVWAAWGDLLHTVRTGQNAFRHVHGVDTWQFRAACPEESAIFDAAMRETTSRIAASLPARYDFGRFRCIVDIGGGNGTLLAKLLAGAPHATGVLLDLPHVVANARTVLLADDVSHRATIVPGSFFEAVPSGGDLYVLKHVIHDWEDEDAAAILGNCRRAMSADARLILIERILGGTNDDSDTALSDLNMLVNAGGRERTKDELGHLLNEAGLAMTSVTPLPSSQFIIEATTAP